MKMVYTMVNGLSTMKMVKKKKKEHLKKGMHMISGFSIMKKAIKPKKAYLTMV